jgi:hypothetical protein
MGGPRLRERNPSTMKLTLAIKSLEDWRQLAPLLAVVTAGPVAGLAAAALPAGLPSRQRSVSAGQGLDPFNAAVLLTHLAQRVAAEEERGRGGAAARSADDAALLERLQVGGRRGVWGTQQSCVDPHGCVLLLMQ